MSSLILTADDADFQQYLDEPTDTARIKPATEFLDEVMTAIFDTPAISGAALPWDKAYDKLRFRPGEVTLWVGMNGHGKSMMTSHVMLDFLFQGEKVCIASFEMKPQSTLKRMARQVNGISTPSREQVQAFLSFCQGRLWIYDQLGSVDANNLLAIIRYCKTKLGITQFVVDSLMKCVRGEDDYNGQKMFVDSLCTLARDFGVHIHLIHHSRKLSDEFAPPGKMDSKGSGAITDLVDQVVTVWRNKRKELLFQTASSDYDPTSPDAMLIVDKNRHGEWEGRIGIYFDAPSQSYTEWQNRPKQYDLSDYLPQMGEPV